MAGGGIKGGVNLGATDELGYSIVENPVTVHDLQATMLHLLGLDAWKLRFPYQGLDQKIIGVEGDAGAEGTAGLTRNGKVVSAAGPVDPILSNSAISNGRPMLLPARSSSA